MSSSEIIDVDKEREEAEGADETMHTPLQPPEDINSLSLRINKALQAFILFLYDNWFVCGVCVAIGLAAAWPELGRRDGYIKSQWTIKYGAVIIIFILSGMGLKTEVLVQSLRRPFLHLLIQAFSLGLTPFVGWGVGTAMLKTPLNSSFSLGYIVACAMPTTVSESYPPIDLSLSCSRFFPLRHQCRLHQASRRE